MYFLDKSSPSNFNFLDFQRTLFLMFLFFQKYLNTQVRTNKIINSVVYKPCPSRLASRIHAFISWQNACWIFSNLYISPCMWKCFNYGVHIPRKCIESMYFYHSQFPTQNSRQKCFENPFPQRQKGVKTCDLFYQNSIKKYEDDLEH